MQYEPRYTPINRERAASGQAPTWRLPLNECSRRWKSDWRPRSRVERLARQSGARLLEENLRSAELGVGSALGFMPFALAADFLAEHIERRFNLFHRPDAVTLVVVIGLREGRVSVV
jgi:hypothetical protein